MHTPEFIWLFATALFAIAFLYSSIGHGGASGYLALMALYGFQPVIMKPAALLLNIIVSLVSFFHFYKAGFFRWKLFIPFAVTSVPASFIGALITLDTDDYKKVLAVLLVFPILRLMGFFGKPEAAVKDVHTVTALAAGALIGLVSGMTGIGGGILLGPLILLMHWGGMKDTAAASALFILVNSVAGMLGLLSAGTQPDPQVLNWVAPGIAGALAGGYFGAKKFGNSTLKALLASVLLLACVKLLTVGSTQVT